MDVFGNRCRKASIDQPPSTSCACSEPLTPQSTAPHDANKFNQGVVRRLLSSNNTKQQSRSKNCAKRKYLACDNHTPMFNTLLVSRIQVVHRDQY